LKLREGGGEKSPKFFLQGKFFVRVSDREERSFFKRRHPSYKKKDLRKIRKRQNFDDFDFVRRFGQYIDDISLPPHTPPLPPADLPVFPKKMGGEFHPPRAIIS